MSSLLILVPIVCLVLLIRAIYGSNRRWLSFGYAVLGFLIPLVLGIVLMFILIPQHAAAVADTSSVLADPVQDSLSKQANLIASVAHTNSVLDMIGNAIQLAGPIAAVWAANIPPRRVKA